jgi:hypothetical protein
MAAWQPLGWIKTVEKYLAEQYRNKDISCYSIIIANAVSTQCHPDEATNYWL